MNIAYKRIEGKTTSYNSATKHVFNNAVKREDDGVVIDYSKVLVSSGYMPVMNGVTVSVSAGRAYGWRFEVSYA